jgi:hypothetical protein
VNKKNPEFPILRRSTVLKAAAGIHLLEKLNLHVFSVSDNTIDKKKNFIQSRYIYMELMYFLAGIFLKQIYRPERYLVGD